MIIKEEKITETLDDSIRTVLWRVRRSDRVMVKRAEMSEGQSWLKMVCRQDRDTDSGRKVNSSALSCTQYAKKNNSTSEKTV